MDKSIQIRSSTLYLLPVIVTNALPIITLPVFTRILTVEEYGAYALALVYAIFLNGICNFGLGIVYERNFFEFTSHRDKSGLFYSILLFVLSTIAFAAFITFIFKKNLASIIIGDSSYDYLLFYAFCGVSLMNFKQYFLTYFKNTQDVKNYVVYMIIESVILTAFSLFLIVFLEVGVIGLPLGQFFASGLICLILFVKFTSFLPFRTNWSLLRNSLKLSFPLTPRIFLGVIGTQFDKYMLGILGALGGVGVYTIGQKIGNITFTFMSAIQNVFAPQVYKLMFSEESEGAVTIGRFLTPYFYVSILGGLILALFSEEVILILTPESYHGSIEIVSILCLLYGIYFFGKQPQLIYAKKTWMVSILTMIGIVLNVAINIPFIKMWGAIGAAFGTLLAGVISNAITFYLSQKAYTIKWESSKLIWILFLFFLAVTIHLLLREFGAPYEYRLFIKVVFVFFYLLLGNNIGLITRNNLHTLKSLFSAVK